MATTPRTGLSLKLFDILKLKLPTLKFEECKLHLACWNGKDHPLDVFLAGRFPEWQSWQNKKNFGRRFIVSLIEMRPASKWLFGGVHVAYGCKVHETGQGYSYHTEEVPELEGFTGRLIIELARPFRQSYPNAETLSDQLMVSELKPRRLDVGEFPGFTSVLLSKLKLEIVVAQGIESWWSALSSVAGVYLITDTKTGRHYVGSAYGAGGIWGRWKDYSESGHGNNKHLKHLLEKEGPNYSSNFQFSILETADTNASEDEVLARDALEERALQPGKPRRLQRELKQNPR